VDDPWRLRGGPDPWTPPASYATVRALDQTGSFLPVFKRTLNLIISIVIIKG